MPSESEMKSLEDEAKKLMQDARSDVQREEEGAKRDEEMAARIAKLKGTNTTSNTGKYNHLDSLILDF